MINFKYGSQEDYNSLQSKDSNTLYFISDGKIYKGEILVGNNGYQILTAMNTETVNTTISGNTISMNLTQNALNQIMNSGTQWEEIPTP